MDSKLQRTHYQVSVFLVFQCPNLNASDYLIVCDFPSKPKYTNHSPNV